MSNSLSPIKQECAVVFDSPVISERSLNQAILEVAQKAIKPQLDEGGKPNLPQGHIIPLHLGDSNEELTNSSSPTEDDAIRASSVRAQDDKWVVVEEHEVSASPDTVISISPKPGIISKAFTRIFKKSDEQIAPSILKEIDKKYKQFNKAIKSGQSFESVKTSLNDEAFISRIIELKTHSESYNDKISQKIKDGLQLFKQMMKALEFIDVATQLDPSIKLNTIQIQVIKSILEGTTDPLYQTPESRVLGQGTYGKVDETSPSLPDKSSLVSYAIKCCNTGDKSALEELQTEYEVLMSFDHPNIIRPIYVHDRVFYMELADGGPLNKKCRGMEGKRLIKTLIQTADALAHMHQRGYVHGDVKADNIFLTKELDAKVGDLGLCRLQDNFNFDFEDAYDAYYFPPECLSGAINTMDEVAKKQAALKIDSWSFGAMLWWMLKNSDKKSLYEYKQPMSERELRETIIEAPQLLKFTQNRCDIATIMCVCLEPDFTKRPTMAEVRDMLKRGRV